MQILANGQPGCHVIESGECKDSAAVSAKWRENLSGVGFSAGRWYSV